MSWEAGYWWKLVTLSTWWIWSFKICKLSEPDYNMYRMVIKALFRRGLDTALVFENDNDFCALYATFLIQIRYPKLLVDLVAVVGRGDVKYGNIGTRI